MADHRQLSRLGRAKRPGAETSPAVQLAPISDRTRLIHVRCRRGRNRQLPFHLPTYAEPITSAVTAAISTFSRCCSALKRRIADTSVLRRRLTAAHTGTIDPIAITTPPSSQRFGVTAIVHHIDCRGANSQLSGRSNRCPICYRTAWTTLSRWPCSLGHCPILLVATRKGGSLRPPVVVTRITAMMRAEHVSPARSCEAISWLVNFRPCCGAWLSRASGQRSAQLSGPASATWGRTAVGRSQARDTSPAPVGRRC